MRGERAMLNPSISSSNGSSPHARGTPSHDPREHRRIRFIPACAGNARTARTSLPPISVHPRMRGERSGDCTGEHEKCGSSPHARGTRIRRQFPRIPHRFIPACAGNASAFTSSGHLLSVHPRMRGERWTPPLLMPPSVGSSPHARGTPNSQMVDGLRSRFIPACAGNAK